MRAKSPNPSDVIKRKKASEFHSFTLFLPDQLPEDRVCRRQSNEEVDNSYDMNINTNAAASTHVLKRKKMREKKNELALSKTLYESLCYSRKISAVQITPGGQKLKCYSCFSIYDTGSLFGSGPAKNMGSCRSGLIGNRLH